MPASDNPDHRNDGFMSYELALRVIREQRVRAGIYAPHGEREERWAAEGPVSVNRLEVMCGPG